MRRDTAGWRSFRSGNTKPASRLRPMTRLRHSGYPDQDHAKNGRHTTFVSGLPRCYAFAGARQPGDVHQSDNSGFGQLRDGPMDRWPFRSGPAGFSARVDLAAAHLQLCAAWHLLHFVRAAIDLVSFRVSREFSFQRLGFRSIRNVCHLHGGSWDPDLRRQPRARLLTSADPTVWLLWRSFRHAGGYRRALWRHRVHAVPASHQHQGALYRDHLRPRFDRVFLHQFADVRLCAARRSGWRVALHTDGFASWRSFCAQRAVVRDAECVLSVEAPKSRKELRSLQEVAGAHGSVRW